MRNTTCKRFVLAGCMLAGGTAQASEVRLDVATGRPILAANQHQKAYLKIGLTGFDLPGGTKRAPVNLAIVLDRSSSMAGDKIEKAKEAALMVIERLGPEDIVSVITYDSTVETLIPATKLTDREAIAEQIRAIAPRGSTALFAGVSKGIAEAKKFLADERVNRIILLSDGQANIGPSSPNALGRLGAAAAEMGVSITTIGLGLGYNEDLMSQLALKSDGNHAFAENADQLAQIFNFELGDVLSVVAQEVAVRVELPDWVRPIKVLNRDARIHGQKIYLQLNQLYAKQEKYFLLELEVAPRKDGERLDLAEIHLSYANLATMKTDHRSRKLAVEFSAQPALVAKSENREVMVAAVEALGAE